MRFLLTLILVAWATPAGAQISAGPTGGLAVVDDNGKLIGGFMGPIGSAVDPYVTLNTPQGSGFIQLFGATLSDGAYSGFSINNEPVYFATPDCTGQAHFAFSSFSPVLNGMRLVQGLEQTLYASSEPETSVTLASYIDSDGVCQPTSGASDLYPAAVVGDLAAEFTPPFHIVTVASQQSASVPMQIGWLLGGLLLGLGVKRAVKR